MSTCLSRTAQCYFLGDTWCGTDVDAVFAYQTPKAVKIKDRTLGLTRLWLTLAIFLYIVVFQVAYNGEHFEEEAIDGLHRLQFQQPTKGHCNPMDVQCDDNFASPMTLPYCTQYVGDQPATFQKQCILKDALGLPIVLPGGVLVPTYIEKFAQVKVCPSDEEDCVKEYRYANNVSRRATLERGTGEATARNAAFVNDVEDFSLMIDHSFSTRSGSMGFDDFKMQGYYLDYSADGENYEKKPMKCEHEHCERLGLEFPQVTSSPSNGSIARRLGRRQERQADSFLEVDEGDDKFSGRRVFSIKDGDVMSFKTLLAIAARPSVGTEHPVGGYTLDDVVNEKGETRRLRGAAVVITIRYSNFAHWRIFSVKERPEYTLSVQLRPAEEFKTIFISEQAPAAREVEKAYGTYVIVQQVGNIQTFSALNALIVITPALGLLAMANVLTDFLALYVMPRSEVYGELKYQESENVHYMESVKSDSPKA